MSNDEDLQVPVEFVCPISQTIMVDPVTTVDGQTYERRCIAAWLRPGRMRSPNTNQVLPNARLAPNYSLKAAIERWRGGSELRKAREIEQRDILFAVQLRENEVSIKDDAVIRLRTEIGQLRDENQELRNVLRKRDRLATDFMSKLKSLSGSPMQQSKKRKRNGKEEAEVSSSSDGRGTAIASKYELAEWKLARSLLDKACYQKAIESLTAAADKGNPSAPVKLYITYKFKRVQQDAEREEKWKRRAIEVLPKLRAAVDSGIADAQVSMGHLKQDGVGVRKDLAAAACLFRKAAEQGDKYGQYNSSDAVLIGASRRLRSIIAWQWWSRALEGSCVTG